MLTLSEEARIEWPLLQSPPTHQTMDFVRMGTLIALFLIGSPLAIAAYFHLKSPILFGSRPESGDIQLLKRSLNLSDLLVLLILTVSEICWIGTLQWRGGLLLCKAVGFLRSLALFSSSNTVASLALNRALSQSDFPIGSAERQRRRIGLLLLLSWILAFLTSIPELFVWSCVQPFPNNRDYIQCADAWEIWRETQGAYGEAFVVSETAYSVLRLLFLLILPCLVIVVSYAILARKLNCPQRFKSLRNRLMQSSEAETVEEVQLWLPRSTQQQSAAKETDHVRLVEEGGGKARLSLVLVLLFVCLRTPFHFVQLFPTSPASSAFIVLVPLNSVLNALVYGNFRPFRQCLLDA